MPREYMFPPGHTSVASLTRVTGSKRKFATMPTSWDEAEEGMELFATQVMPALREEFPDS